jgi:hypothetical protein
MVDYPSRIVPPLVTTLAEQSLKMYPRVEGVCRDDATDNVRQLELWAKEYGRCGWAVATGPDFNVIALEVIEDRGKEMIDDMIANGDLEESENGFNTLCIGSQDGSWRPIFFWKYPQGNRAKTPGRVDFSRRGVILQVEGGCVTLPKKPTHAGTDDIAECPNGLKDAAFTDIEERSLGNDSGPEKPTAIGVPKERDLENRMIA